MGAVNIDNTGSGSSVTLSSNGTQLLLNGTAVGGASAVTISNKTGAYTVVSGDLGAVINCTSGSFTVALTAAASLGSGFNCWIWNTSTTATDVITIDPNGAETIDGVATLTLQRGEGTQIVCNGTNWLTGDKKTMRGYAENIPADSTLGARPIATGSGGVAVGAGSTASGSYSFAQGKATASGAGALAIGGYLLGTGTVTASGNASIAMGMFNSAATASSAYSTAIGLNSAGDAAQAVTGAGAMALGGSYASGASSFAAAVANNTSSYGARGANSVSIGWLTSATATGTQAFGYRASATANQATAIGSFAVASGLGALALSTELSGYYTTASATYSVAVGNMALSNIASKYAYSGGGFVDAGDAQTGTFVLRNATTNATATVLTTNGSAAGSTNQVILPNSSAYVFSGIVVARQQAAGGTASAAWKVEGLIRREGSVGTTTLVASTVTAISNVPGWTIALSANTTYGGLAVTATGAAATNIRWVATINTSEVTYA